MGVAFRVAFRVAVRVAVNWAVGVVFEWFEWHDVKFGAWSCVLRWQLKLWLE